MPQDAGPTTRAIVDVTDPAMVILTYFMFVVSDVSARYQALIDESSPVLLGFCVRSGLSCSELVAPLVVRVP